MIAGSIQTDDVRELYRDLILDHARHPRHFGKLGHVTHTAEGINPLCGDKLRLYLDVDANETIRDAAFEGSGCAISVASASLLTDTVIGLSTGEAMTFFGAVTASCARWQASGTSRHGSSAPRLHGTHSNQHYGWTRRQPVRNRTTDVRTHQ